MTDTSLDYNARAAVPESADIIRGWTLAGAHARRVQAALLDLPYGSEDAERLDLFPTRRQPAPLLVFLHGGYWRALDKRDFAWLAAPWVARGVAVAIPNYGLAPGTSIDDMVRQMLRAHAWLYRRAEALGLDAKRIACVGHSAGAHLAAMMTAARWSEWDATLPSRLLCATVCLSGLFDLEPLRHASFLQPTLKLSPESVQRLSPVGFAEPVQAGPVRLWVGERESAAFHAQSAQLHAAWPNITSAPRVAEGRDHFTLCNALADTDHPLFSDTLSLLLN
jgi:arylformamidase